MESTELQELLPYRGKMLFLSRLLHYDIVERTLTAEYDVSTESLFYDSHLGGIPSWAAFELMAQGVSALSGLTGRELGRKPMAGFLLSVSAMDFPKPLFPAGKSVRIRVWEDSRAEPVYTFNGEVSVQGEMAALGKFTVMDVEDLT
jgi:predicted hotdog family 3-hydroxylacyl-ACP dehydratase